MRSLNLRLPRDDWVPAPLVNGHSQTKSGSACMISLACSIAAYVQTSGYVGVIGSQRLFIDGQRSLVQRFSAV